MGLSVSIEFNVGPGLCIFISFWTGASLAGSSGHLYASSSGLEASPGAQTGHTVRRRTKIQRGPYINLAHTIRLNPRVDHYSHNQRQGQRGFLKMKGK